MTMLKSKAVVLAKIETTYGTDSTPVFGTNAILVESPDIEVIGKKIERANVKPFYGAKPFVSLGQGLKLTYITELKGLGATPAVAPEIGVLFRMCNFTETLVTTPGSECAKYAPHSNPDGESGTQYFWRDGFLHKLVGCRGNGPELSSKVNEYGKLKWEFHGIYAGPVDNVAMPTAPVFNTTKPPLFRGANFAIDTYGAVIESIKVAVKNDLAMRPDANAATGIVSMFIKERSITGEIDPEMVVKATKDFWGLWEGNNQVAMTASFGTVAGNRCVVSAPAVQIDTPKYADRDNILTLGLPLVFVPTVAGNDEVEFKFN